MKHLSDIVFKASALIALTLSVNAKAQSLYYYLANPDAYPGGRDVLTQRMKAVDDGIAQAFGYSSWADPRIQNSKGHSKGGYSGMIAPAPAPAPIVTPPPAPAPIAAPVAPPPAPAPITAPVAPPPAVSIVNDTAASNGDGVDLTSLAMPTNNVPANVSLAPTLSPSEQEQATKLVTDQILQFMDVGQKANEAIATSLKGVTAESVQTSIAESLKTTNDTSKTNLVATIALPSSSNPWSKPEIAKAGQDALDKQNTLTPPNPLATGEAQCRGATVTLRGNSVFRFFMAAYGEHFLTNSVAEGCGANYELEGEAFQTYDASSPNAKPLYRCFMGPIAQGHSASASADCEGGINEGIYGYMLSQPAPGAVPLYRVQFASSRDALVTIRESEANLPAGSNKVILGYVIAPSGSLAIK